MALILSSDLTITNPDPNAPVLQKTLASDGFSGANVPTILGRMMDAFAGGAALTWQGANDSAGASLGIASGRAQRPASSTATGTWAAVMPMAVADYEVSFDLLAYPVGGNATVYLRRNYPGTNGYILILTATGGVTIQKIVSPDVTTLKAYVGGAAPAVGETIGFGVSGSVLYFLRNGAVVWAAADSAITAAGHAGFNGAGAVTAFALDNLIVRTARTVAPAS